MKADDNNKNPISQAIEDWFFDSDAKSTKETPQNAFFHYLDDLYSAKKSAGETLDFGKATLSFIEDHFGKNFIFPECVIGQNSEQKSPWVIRFKGRVFYPSNLNTFRFKCATKQLFITDVNPSESFLFSKCVFDFQPKYLTLLNHSLKILLAKKTAPIFTPEIYHALCSNEEFKKEKLFFDALFENRYAFDVENINLEITALKKQKTLAQERIDLLQAQADSYDRISTAPDISDLSKKIETLSSTNLRIFFNLLPLDKWLAINDFSIVCEYLKLHIPSQHPEEIRAKKKIILHEFTNGLTNYKNFLEFEKLFMSISDLQPSDIPDELLAHWLESIPPKFINLIEKYCPDDLTKTKWVFCCIENTAKTCTFLCFLYSRYVGDIARKNILSGIEVNFKELDVLIGNLNACEDAETQETFWRHVIENPEWEENLNNVLKSISTKTELINIFKACKTPDIMQSIVLLLPDKTKKLIKEKISHDIDDLIEFLSACHFPQIQLWILGVICGGARNVRSAARNALLDNRCTLAHFLLLLQKASLKVKIRLFGADRVFFNIFPIPFFPNTEFYAIWGRIMSLIKTRDEFTTIFGLLPRWVQMDFFLISTPEREATLAKLLQKDTHTFDEIDKILNLCLFSEALPSILNLYPNKQMKDLLTEPQHLKKIFSIHKHVLWDPGLLSQQISFIQHLDKEENKAWLKTFMLTRVQDMGTLSDIVSASGDPKIWQLLRACYSDDELLSFIKTPNDLIVRLQLPEKLGNYDDAWQKPPELYFYTYTVWSLEEFKTEKKYSLWLKNFMITQVRDTDTLSKVVLACKDPQIQQIMMGHYSDENFLSLIKTPDDLIRLSQLRKALSFQMPFIANLYRGTHKIWLQNFIQKNTDSFDKIFIECDNNDMRKILIDHYDLGTHITTKKQYLALRNCCKTHDEKSYFDTRVGRNTLRLVLPKDSPLMARSSKLSSQQPSEEQPKLSDNRPTYG